MNSILDLVDQQETVSATRECECDAEYAHCAVSQSLQRYGLGMGLVPHQRAAPMTVVVGFVVANHGDALNLALEHKIQCSQYKIFVIG